MAKSVNKVILIGNLGKDPEIKYTPSGTPVAKFSLATNERYKDKGGEWQDRTEWHNIVAWQRLAEIVGEYVKKGSKLYIEGRLQTSSWEDKQSGEKKYRTEIVANDLVLLSGRGEGDSEGRFSRGASASHGSMDQRSTDQRSMDQRDQRSQHADEMSQGAEITDEDIPF
jgi:single-strand DNA-binding protein